MELLALEARRAEHWQAQLAAQAPQGGAAAAAAASAAEHLGAKLLRGEALAPGEQRLSVALARQEPGIYLGVSLLLNMAEADAGVELKMVRKASAWSGCGCGLSHCCGRMAYADASLG